jgi:5'-3' exonuclease
MTVALIDGDILAFRTAIAAQENWDGEVIVDVNKAIRDVDMAFKEWTKLIKPNRSVVTFSDPGRVYFRHFVDPTYKGNRVSIERPQALTDVINHIKGKYECTWREGLEADDVMGILAGSPALTDPVIVTMDKDLQTIPGKWFNPFKIKRPLRINQRLADLNWLGQTLTGDATDGYKGCPGIGPKRAEKILSSSSVFRELWAIIERTYEDAGLTANDAITQARLARILRFTDYREETGEIKLWHPKEEIWLKWSTIRDTMSKDQSKLPTTSSASSETSPETKHGVSQTSSSTSADTATSTQTRRKRTSKKQVGTSTD